MLGTTSTQVLGNQALNVVAGREASKQITRQAAAQAGASEMIAEYLLPVVAAMLVGALADASREGLESLMRRDGDGDRPSVHTRRRSGPRRRPASSGRRGWRRLLGQHRRRDRPCKAGRRFGASRRACGKHQGRSCAPRWPRCCRRDPSDPGAALSLAEGAARLDRSPSRSRRKRLQNGTRPQASMSLQAEGPKATDEGCGDYRQGRAFDVAVPPRRRPLAVHPLPGRTTVTRPIAAVLEIGEVRPRADRLALRGPLVRLCATAAEVPMVGHAKAAALMPQRIECWRSPV